MTIKRSGIQVMGILNVTPDSFSDGGQFHRPDYALRHAQDMINQGADIIDIGGESTRPGAAEVSVQEELDRVIPLLEHLKQHFDTPISVDTSKAIVMQEAIKQGAAMINDVRALSEEGALQACAHSDIAICLMHMQGQPRTMQQNPNYQDVVQDVSTFLQQRVESCQQVGIDKDRLWLDPGFGFGKTLEHNLCLLQHLDKLQSLGLPLLVGMSRKTMIGQILNNRPVDDRVLGSVGAAVVSVLKGANIVRVHDVKETADALAIIKALNSIDSDA